MIFPVDWLQVGDQKVQIDAVVYFLWSIWNGWIMATVGAFGGIMAGFGHISVLGLGAKASSLKGIKATVNGKEVDSGKYLSDNIRLSNSLITSVNSTMGTIQWFLNKRLIWTAGLAMGIGSVLGAQAGVWLTGGKLNMSSVIGIFGCLTLLVSIFMFYQVTPFAAKAKSKGKDAAKRFQEEVKKLKAEGRLNELKGIENLKLSLAAVEFDFFGEHFKVKNFGPFLFGIIVGFVSAVAGVGGGFLYVPFLSIVLGLPFYIVPGASVMAVTLGMLSTIVGWLVFGIKIAPPILIGMAGILIGAYIGPKTQKYLPMNFLYILFGVLAIYVGVGYIMKGFFAIALPGV
ncbi:protein of unknown function DUF81 [Thermodesulfobium narugense DSM 14796]|uniref:Probable membrane transporter protein n=2 Tax=Thermodesulfobium narugense TaxID=184064 RepID=M1E7A7_9BACT|nr:sulfite exporter TauE/SafE family protein [Thermodesulfobium narugense]AEE14568.1 protein of unknown function DUF81 [Thermodesulfobium narugense DSM 14796]AEE15201.1 protein of unknown function DUF81 [Thermodesulfobium narugense DSM 14796]